MGARSCVPSIFVLNLKQTLLQLHRYFTSVLKAAAAKHCGGKLLFFHEGGYSAYYVPFCGLAVMEELTGVTTHVVDPELEEHCKVSHLGEEGGEGEGL